MIECPGCGADLRFDIENQCMVCSHCKNTYDPKTLPWGKTASLEKNGEYETTVFSCPQCGGEIVSTGNEAADFCSFCGASVVLEGRASREKAPKYIIPFSVDRKRSINRLLDMTSRMYFVPKEYRSEAYLGKAVPFYIPYWIYDVSQEGEAKLSGTRTKDKYLETVHVTWTLETEYSTILFDASAAFDDDLSRLLAPYHERKMEDFHPAYLSGFYADVSDVEPEVYIEDAKAAANERTFQRISLSTSEGGELKCIKPADMNSTFHTQLKEIKSAMLPVWFLTWRKKDRVAYSVVNGETGEAVGDIPIDIGKFLFFCGGTAAGLFVIFYFLFPYLVPDLALSLAVFIALAAMEISQKALSVLYRREFHVEDKGFLTGISSDKRPKSLKPSQKIRMPAFVFTLLINLFALALRFLLTNWVMFFSFIGYAYRYVFIGIFIVYLGIQLTRWIPLLLVMKDALMISLGILLIISVIGSCLVIFINPISDPVYYGMMLVLTASITALLTAMVGKFNKLATRPLPEFFSRGKER